MFVGREGGCKPCVFHLRQVFECLPRNRWGVGVVEAANPEFQVVRKKREGQKSRRGGSQEGTRDAVSSLERERGMRVGGQRGHCLA